jgi:hypothetical protein
MDQLVSAALNGVTEHVSNGPLGPSRGVPERSGALRGPSGGVLAYDAGGDHQLRLVQLLRDGGLADRRGGSNSERLLPPSADDFG